jgi:TPR repeat protein
MRGRFWLPTLIAALTLIGPAFAADDFSPPFVLSRPLEVVPDAPLPPMPGGPPPDIAFGAFQRGYFLTALREATKRVADNPKDAAAMTLLGEIYRDGLVVRQDLGEAARWYRLASGLGDKNAQFQLGVMLLEDGEPKDKAAARALFEKAAAQNHAGALYNLGVLAIQGDETTKSDFAKAADYFKRAADAGDDNGAYSYGVLVRDGKGVPLDTTLAAAWLKRAADGGIISGQVEYAIMLFNGIGVERDEEGAAKIFKLAAARKNPIAQNRLAHLYLIGRGVPKDILQVALWHSFAKAAGIEDAELDAAIAHLTPEEAKQVRELERRQMEF